MISNVKKSYIYSYRHFLSFFLLLSTYISLASFFCSFSFNIKLLNTCQVIEIICKNVLTICVFEEKMNSQICESSGHLLEIMKLATHFCTITKKNSYVLRYILIFYPRYITNIVSIKEIKLNLASLIQLISKQHQRDTRQGWGMQSSQRTRTKPKFCCHLGMSPWASQFNSFDISFQSMKKG